MKKIVITKLYGDDGELVKTTTEEFQKSEDSDDSKIEDNLAKLIPYYPYIPYNPYIQTLPYQLIPNYYTIVTC